MIVFIVIFFAVISFLFVKSQKRKKYLFDKYSNLEVVNKILRHQYWQGMTREQLQDSLGRPVDIDIKVMRANVNEIWKYDRAGKSRYKRKMYLENDLLIGWEI